MPNKETPAKAPGVRARVRAELTAEIKKAARAQLIAEGAAALSLRAIARELGMASSAIYRYFPSRDDLLTALIIDAYNGSAQLVEDANAACAVDDYPGRFIAIAGALRSWAIANPHEYSLIYGSPVPGYAAPQDTIDPATRIPVALLSVLVDAKGTKDVKASESTLRTSLADLMEFTDHRCSPETVALGVEAWAELFGLISLELFGHFHNAVTDPEAFYTHSIKAIAQRILV